MINSKEYEHSNDTVIKSNNSDMMMMLLITLRSPMLHVPTG